MIVDRFCLETNFHSYICAFSRTKCDRDLEPGSRNTASWYCIKVPISLFSRFIMMNAQIIDRTCYSGRTDGRTREHGKYITGNVTAMTSIHKQARM